MTFQIDLLTHRLYKFTLWVNVFFKIVHIGFKCLYSYNAIFSYVTNVVAILNAKNAIPPIIIGLNLISSPDVVVAIPAINNIIGGGAIFSNVSW